MCPARCERGKRHKRSPFLRRGTGIRRGACPQGFTKREKTNVRFAGRVFRLVGVGMAHADGGESGNTPLQDLCKSNVENAAQDPDDDPLGEEEIADVQPIADLLFAVSQPPDEGQEEGVERDGEQSAERKFQGHVLHQPADDIGQNRGDEGSERAERNVPQGAARNKVRNDAADEQRGYRLYVKEGQDGQHFGDAELDSAACDGDAGEGERDVQRRHHARAGKHESRPFFHMILYLGFFIRKCLPKTFRAFDIVPRPPASCQAFLPPCGAIKKQGESPAQGGIFKGQCPLNGVYKGQRPLIMNSQSKPKGLRLYRLRR